MHVMAYIPRGAEGIIVRVETDIRRGIPGIDITGLAEGAVREARERVRVSFRNSGFSFPMDRILINLAPAGQRKEGAALDLPIAISVMAAAGMVSLTDNLMVLGELELSGRLRPVRGVLAAIAAGITEGIRDFIVPLENANEAAVLGGIRFFAAATLAEAVHALLVRAESGELPEGGVAAPACQADDEMYAGDFSEVKGQERYKRALEIAAAGGHNLFVFGPPGSGKTMLARRFPSILPTLEPEEAVEVTRLYSLAGQFTAPQNAPHSAQFAAYGLITKAPFRSPHHSASVEGILGGGRHIRPGEISMAHFGTLFLDEAPEFRRPVLQSLREALEDRSITIARAEGSHRLPADFQLILAANSCPCGRLGGTHISASGGELSGGGAPSMGGEINTTGEGMSAASSVLLYSDSGCFCTPDEIRRYWKKLGSALLDRIELRIPVRSPGVLKPLGGGGETSAEIRRRVQSAVEIQRRRFKGLGIRRNSRMLPAQIDSFCHLSNKAEEVFTIAAERLSLSGRACHAILKIGRTIADLEGNPSIDTVHILEAVQHRRFGDDPYDIISVDG